MMMFIIEVSSSSRVILSGEIIGEVFLFVGVMVMWVWVVVVDR